MLHSMVGRRRHGAGHRPQGRTSRRILRCGLGALALLVQLFLPLADARWHAAGAPAHPLQVAAAKPSAAGKTAPQPGLADDGCQLCLAIQLSGATLAAATPTPAAPSAFVRLAAVLPPEDARPAARVAPHRARAPPTRA